MMWEMIFREFGRHKIRTVLTVLGVTIGILLVTTISSFSEGITQYVNDRIAITSGLVFVIESDVPMQSMQRSEINEDLISELETIPGVQKIAPVLFYRSDGTTVLGTDPDQEQIVRGVSIEIEDGRDVQPGAGEVVIGSGFAEKNSYGVGDTLEIKDKKFEIVGVLEESGDADIDDNVHMALSDLQDLTGKEKIVSMFMIQPLSPSFAQSIERSINDDFDEIHAASDKSIMNSVNDMLDQLNMTTFALGSIAAIISGIVIMNVMIISVRERRREIGIMKAIGATNSQVLITILLESVSLSVIGAVLGIFLSFGGVVFVNTILFSPIAIITPRLIMQGILFAASIGAVSGILPARQAAGLNPIEALVYE